MGHKAHGAHHGHHGLLGHKAHKGHYGTIHHVEEAFEKEDGSAEYKKDGKWHKLDAGSTYSFSETLMNLNQMKP